MTLALSILGATMVAGFVVLVCAWWLSARFARMEEAARREQLERERRQEMARQFCADVLRVSKEGQ